MTSHANSPWAPLTQDTAGIANLTPPTPFPSGIQVTLPNSRFFCPQDHYKIEKTAPPLQTTSQFILIKHSLFGSNHGTSSIHRQHQTIPHHQAIASTSTLVEFCSRTHQDTPNQAQALPHTPQNTHQSNIDILEEITATLPSTDNAKRSLTTRLLPTLQLSRQSLENLRRYTQSSASFPSHLPKFTSIEHRHSGSNRGAAATTQRYTMVLHNQAIDSIPIFVKIA